MDVGSSEVVAEVVASTAGSLGPVIQSGPEGLYWPGPHSGKDCLPAEEPGTCPGSRSVLSSAPVVSDRWQWFAA